MNLKHEPISYDDYYEILMFMILKYEFTYVEM